MDLLNQGRRIVSETGSSTRSRSENSLGGTMEIALKMQLDRLSQPHKL
jgi:hypothetical protein